MQTPQCWPLLHFHLQLHILNAVKADLRTRCDLQTYTWYMSHSNCSGLQWESQRAHKKAVFWDEIVKMYEKIKERLDFCRAFCPQYQNATGYTEAQNWLSLSLIKVFGCIMLESAVAETKITLISDPYSTAVLLGRSGRVSPCFWTFSIEASMVQVQVTIVCNAENAASESWMSFPAASPVIPVRFLAASWGALGCSCGTGCMVVLGLRAMLHNPCFAPGCVSSAPCFSHIADTGLQISSSISFPLLL